MNLLDKVNAQLKESALKQDKDKVLTLRLIVSALKDKEIEKRGYNRAVSAPGVDLREQFIEKYTTAEL